MSGSLGLAALQSLYSSTFNAGSTLLNTLYGIGSSSAGSSPQAALQALSAAETGETRELKVTAAQPQVQHDLAAFTKGVNSAKSVSQLLANPAVMKVILTANGLGDQTAYTALATKVLTSDLTDPHSLANVLTDTRWKTLAQTYNFAANGLTGIQSATTLSAISNGYVQVTWENSQDSVTPGLSNALKFKNEASTITSVDQILSDPTLRTVVTTALGVPEQIAFQSLNAQEVAISSRVDIKRFQDPKFVESFTQRYLIANAGTSTSTTPDLTTLAIQSTGVLV